MAPYSKVENEQILCAALAGEARQPFDSEPPEMVYEYDYINGNINESYGEKSQRETAARRRAALYTSGSGAKLSVFIRRREADHKLAFPEGADKSETVAYQYILNILPPNCQAQARTLFPLHHRRATTLTTGTVTNLTNICST